MFILKTFSFKQIASMKAVYLWKFTGKKVLDSSQQSFTNNKASNSTNCVDFIWSIFKHFPLCTSSASSAGSAVFVLVFWVARTSKTSSNTAGYKPAFSYRVLQPPPSYLPWRVKDLCMRYFQSQPEVGSEVKKPCFIMLLLWWVDLGAMIPGGVIQFCVWDSLVP